MSRYLLINGDARRLPLPDGSVDCCVTSPPYWGLRDYGVDGQIGLERSPDEFVACMVAVFREARRVLHPSGTCWVNLGDSFSSGGRTTQCQPTLRANQIGVASRPPVFDGLKPKDLVGIPWRVALALRDDGWYLRSEITWCKTSPMPESVRDRPTSATEKLFMLAKSESYFYDQEAVRVPVKASTIERDNSTRITDGKDARGGPFRIQHDHETPSNPGGRNLWNYWVISSESYKGSHFATFPRKLVEPCVKAGTSQKGVCPECGAPWEREVERDRSGVGKVCPKDGIAFAERGWTLGQSSGLHSQYFDTRSKTLGWHPTCTHSHPPRPAIVLDPFCGSGTTGVVANALGRHFVGVDLSRDYLVNQASRRLSRPHAAPIRPDRGEGLPLFDRPHSPSEATT